MSRPIVLTIANLLMKMSLAGFALVVSALCRDHRASVTSWIRTTKRNQAKGGNAGSFHLTGLGADLVCDDPADNLPLMRDARAAGLDAINEGDHVHVEADPKTPPPKG